MIYMYYKMTLKKKHTFAIRGHFVKVSQGLLVGLVSSMAIPFNKHTPPVDER